MSSALSGPTAIRTRHRHNPVVRWPQRYDEATVRQYPAPRIEVPGMYMDRNDRLIAEANVLLAFPSTPHEFTRSGRRGIPVHIYPLNGATHAQA